MRRRRRPRWIRSEGGCWPSWPGPGRPVSLAALVGLPRQKVNYHLRELERHGLVELVEERRKGNMTERVMQATASSYVISPVALAAVAPDPGNAPDRLSARWLLAVAARLVGDVGALISGATRAGKRVATFAVDGEVRFASAADRSAFAEELAACVIGLIGKYHDDGAASGRKYRVVAAVHPALDSRAGRDIEEDTEADRPASRAGEKEN